MWLRQSTASQEILLGRFVDSADGNSEETTLTINAGDIKLWKEGATTLTDKNSGGATHIANGLYYAVLDATDTNTLGKLEVHVHVSGALAVKREYMVLPAVVYDALVLGTDNLDVSVTQWTGTNVATPDTAGYPKVTVKSGTGTGEVSLTSGVAAVNVTQWLGQAAAAVNTAGVPKVDVVLVNGGAASTVAGPIDANVTQVAGETASATGPVDFDDLHSADDVWAVGTRTLSAFSFSVTVGTNNDKTGYSLATAPPTAAAIADAVWDEVLSGHLTAGSTGAGLNSASSAGDPWNTAIPGAYGSGTAGNILGNRLDAAITSRSSHAAADVWSVGTRTITGGTIGTNSDKTGYILASTGLDAISTTAPSGAASTFREMMVQVWRRFFKKTEQDDDANTIKTFADNNSTVVTTQTTSVVGNVKTVGPAS